MNLLTPILLAMSLSGSLGAGEVRRLLDEQLPRTMGQDSIRWTLTSPWSALKLPAGANGVRLVKPEAGIRPGVISCIVQVVQDDQVLRSASVAVRGDRVGRGVRVRRAVRSGEIVSASDLEESWGVLPQGERPVMTASDLEGQRLRRSLSEGGWVTPAAVEQAPVVKVGAPLEIMAASAALRVRFQGVAQQEGLIGDVIRVRGPRPNNLLRARITGPGMALLVP